MNVHRLGGLALAAAVLLSACVGRGEGLRAPYGSMSAQERSLVAYIPEVLRSTCARQYELSSDDCLFSCPTAMDVVALYPGAVAGFTCHYDHVRVDYLRYRTATSLDAALEDRWGFDAEGVRLTGSGTRPSTATASRAGRQGGSFASTATCSTGTVRALLTSHGPTIGPGLHLPAWELERQSQRVPGSHGTHVASIAGGNAGMCPKAFLAGVVVSLTHEDLLSPSSR